VGVKNFCTKLPKGTPLRQIWSNKSFGVCGSDVVLTLYGGEKNVRENRHWKHYVATASIMCKLAYVIRHTVQSKFVIFAVLERQLIHGVINWVQFFSI